MPESEPFAGWRGRRVLVTGHTGFKGAWLCARLAQAGATVSGYALAPESEHALWSTAQLERDVDSTIGDIRDLDTFERAIRHARPATIFHLAAQPLVRRSYREPVATYATNVMGTVHLLDIVRRVRGIEAVVVVTSDKVYADLPQFAPYAEGARLGGADPYAGSKAAAELIVDTYRSAYFQHADAPRIASARAGNVIGGGDWSEDRLIPDIVRATLGGDVLTIRRPDAIRPWQHVLDPLGGYALLAHALLEDATFARAFNFGPPATDTTVQRVIEQFVLAWGGEPAARVRYESTPEHETAYLEIDARLSTELLDWQPRWATTDAIAHTAHWYRDVAAGMPARDAIERDIAAYDTVYKAKLV